MLLTDSAYKGLFLIVPPFMAFQGGLEAEQLVTDVASKGCLPAMLRLVHGEASRLQIHLWAKSAGISSFRTVRFYVGVKVTLAVETLLTNAALEGPITGVHSLMDN